LVISISSPAATASSNDRIFAFTSVAVICVDTWSVSSQVLEEVTFHRPDAGRYASSQQLGLNGAHVAQGPERTPQGALVDAEGTAADDGHPGLRTFVGEISGYGSV
jgi:hypothetical protein